MNFPIAQFVIICVISMVAVHGGKLKSKTFDRFETTIGHWSMFEELVSSCYSDGIGAIEQSSVASKHGGYGLLVWANKNNSVYSNHVIAGWKLMDEGIESSSRYKMLAMMPSEYEETSQVGPEFSVQNTRYINGTSYTAIAGIQYVATKYISQKWNIWKEVSNGVAEWVALPDSLGLPELTVNTWYKFKLKATFKTNFYQSLTIESTDGLYKKSFSLKDIPIALEQRNFEPATWITLEAENLYNNCGTAGPFSSQMYYDNARFSWEP